MSETIDIVSREYTNIETILVANESAVLGIKQSDKLFTGMFLPKKKRGQIEAIARIQCGSPNRAFRAEFAFA